MGLTLKQLREDAAYYCKACPFGTDPEPGGIRCEHSGSARFIAYSSGQCPIGHWDHSKPPTRDTDALAVPRDRWPAHIAEWETRREQTDTGIGDTLARINNAMAVATLVGIAPTVRCAARKRIANQLYPFPKGDPP